LGAFSLAKRLGGSGADGGYDIDADAGGNIYTTGFFNGTADFDPNAGTQNLASAGSGDAFVSKLDTNGNYAFAVRFGASNEDRGRGIVLEASGNVAVMGYFRKTVDFDPGAGTANLASAGSHDIFVSRLSSSGAYVSAQRFGGSGSDMGRAIARDPSDNLFTTGNFEATATFDTGAGVYTLTSAGGQDIFVAKLLAPAPPAAPLGFSSPSTGPQSISLSSPATAPLASSSPALAAAVPLSRPANSIGKPAGVLDEDLLSLLATERSQALQFKGR
jgi:hypothetical protein